MDGLNLEYISKYSKDLSTILVEDVYKNSERLSGKELLEATPVQQLNLFLVKNLFKAWQHETYRLESPYFDYRHPEVAKALKQFMNVLSNHISVTKRDFEPLLINAVQNTLILAYSPYDYFRKEVDSLDKQIEVKELKSIQKYIKVNAHLYKAYLNKVYIETQSWLTKADAFKILDYTFETIEESPEDPSLITEELNHISPLKASMVYLRDVHDDEVGKLAEQDTITVNEQFTNETPQSNSIHRITSIKKNITINQRYMFVNELFGKDTDQFNVALTALDEQTSKEAAMEYLENKIIPKHQWDMESEVVLEFIDIIERRFV